MAHPTERTLQAVDFIYERREYRILDDSIAPDMEYLRTVAVDDFQVISRTLDDSRWIVVYPVDDGPAQREIDEKQAAIVRRIFAEYAGGISPRRIARSLNAEGIPAPRGGPWNASTINGSRQRRNGILNNELYRGRITYNRQRFLKHPETGKRVARPNPEGQWIKIEAAHLRIIDDSLWEAAQTLKARYSSQRGNKRQTRKRLLSGLVKCGACGGSMTIVNRERYSCSAKRERGHVQQPCRYRRSPSWRNGCCPVSRISCLGNETLIEASPKSSRPRLNA